MVGLSLVLLREVVWIMAFFIFYSINLVVDYKLCNINIAGVSIIK